MKRLLVIIGIFISSVSVLPAKSDDGQMKILSHEAQISLLTCSPSDSDVYTLFGHTAIRVKDDSLGIDMAFNYGLFDYDTSNFIYRFIKGETYYKVNAVSTKYFLFDYQYHGRGVSEQILNLTQKEKQDVWVALMLNIQPQNQTYLYNFLYNNCATKARDIILNTIDREVIYGDLDKVQTYRDLLHGCTDVSPWSRFGIDLIIGSDADKPITDMQKDFLPAYLEASFRNAGVGNGIPFVVQEYILLDAQLDLKPKGKIDDPFIMGCFLLLLTFLITLLNYKRKWLTGGRLFDTFLFMITGIGGCIIFFLMFFSIHPSVNPNWNFVWLNPLQFIVAFLFFVKPLQKWIYYYHFINFVLLLLFLLAWGLIPQQFGIAFIPYILAICMRSGVNAVVIRRHK